MSPALYCLDLFGVFIFALSGAMRAVEKELDIFGIFFVALCTAVGGGTLRGVILQRYPLFWVDDVYYLTAVTVALFLVVLAYRRLHRIRNIILFSDALGLGVTTLIGLHHAFVLRLMPPIGIVIAMIGAIAGGIVRDIICNEIPFVMRSELYATACVAGGCCFYALHAVNCPPVIVNVATVLLIMLLRALGICFHTTLPVIRFTDHPLATHPVKDGDL